MSDDWFVTIDTNYDEDYEYENVTVGTKRLINLVDDTFLSLNASIKNDNDINNYYVATDYYFNRCLSVGLAYTWFEELDTDTTSINTNWFITDTFSVNLVINKINNGTYSDNRFNVGTSARF